ncbi:MULTISPECIES: ATP-grasp domain-containing protein [Trichocoleus]|uniref:ATP-grasp domain-containing protein n=1 Tax=Trichocoleus desertorum GB2-A4 TaxID=2933944 RepID=A0ABV0JIT5_9CYAN|nr:ATP-grasp domain-containing protein [Trichocoleus sp. FACHB-46]
MLTTWIVQTNVEPESTSPILLRQACAVEQRPFCEISVIPGCAALPTMPAIDGPVVFHGRTTLILRASEHPKWQRGIFFDPVDFQHRAYAAAYGDQLLNADARITSWEDFLREPRDPAELVFLKPNDDLKRFTGGVLSVAECFTLYQQLRRATRPINPASEVVIGQPREIDGEWRLFIVEGEVVSGSMYRPSGDAYLPHDLVLFAEHIASQWMPAPVFVLDVARVEQTWKVVECNCFNGCRFYLADVARIVRAVSQYQERETH